MGPVERNTHLYPPTAKANPVVRPSEVLLLRAANPAIGEESKKHTTVRLWIHVKQIGMERDTFRSENLEHRTPQ